MSPAYQQLSRLFVLAAVTASLGATTLERLALDDMIAQSTEIVRGKVAGNAVIERNGILFTVSRITVEERWKGPAERPVVEVWIPGGSRGGFKQSFAGAPVLSAGQEAVFFLWTGKSGVTQIIGLSQGLVDLKKDERGEYVTERNPIAVPLVDARSGRAVADEPVRMSLREMRARVRRVLGAAKE